MKKHKMCPGVASLLLATIALGRAFPAPSEPPVFNVQSGDSNDTVRIINVPIAPLSRHNSMPNQKEMQFFWEVTKNPDDITKSISKIVKDDLVDGNHPNSHLKVTHEQIDSTLSGSEQTKRVKKILPPYQSDSQKPYNDAKSNGNINREFKKFPQRRSSEPLRPAVVEELTVTEIRHAAAADIGTESRDKPLRKKANTGKNKKLEIETADEKTKHDETEKHGFFKNSDNVTEKNTFVSQTPIQYINMQSTPLATTNTAKETFRATSDATIEADLILEGNLNRRTKADDTAPDGGINSTDPRDLQIQGIRLVPDEPHIPTTRTMWDLIKEPQMAASEDINNEIYHEPKVLSYAESHTNKPPFENVDAESAEVEYETENFQHGLSNIEKHELPFSYALPWMQVKDKEFDSKEIGKETEKKFENREEKNLPHGTRFAAVSSDEELRIPADMSRLLQLSEVPELGDDVALRVVQSGAADAEPQGRTKWYLLLLTGNSTIVQRRRSDFTKYLRLNLAARLSVEYDDVKVNKLILAPPRVLVNVSVYAPSDDIAEESQLDLKEKQEEKGEGPLHKLAESNATLLELSGEEYRVVRFLSLQAPQPVAQPQQSAQAQAQVQVQVQQQRDEPHQTSMSSRHEDIEFVIYTFLGSACACAVILTIFLALNKYFKKWKELDWPWNHVKDEPPQRIPEPVDPRCPLPPAVIYSGGFPQIRGSWMGGGSQRPVELPINSTSNLLQHYPGVEMGASQPASPRHNKLRMYNCQPDRVLVRKLPESFVEGKTPNNLG